MDTGGWRVNRFLWLIVAGVVALVLTWPLNLLDDWIVGHGWFPKNNLYAGLNGAVFAGIISASIARSRPRKIMGGLAGLIFAVTVIWAMRYIIGLADPSSITIDQSKGYTQVYWTLMFGCGLGTGWLSTMRVSQGRFWAIQFLLVVVSVIAADVATGAMGIDVGTMNRVLYYQTVEIEVHQPVDDADLLYSLKPGARLGVKALGDCERSPSINGALDHPTTAKQNQKAGGGPWCLADPPCMAQVLAMPRPHRGQWMHCWGPTTRSGTLGSVRTTPPSPLTLPCG